MRVFTKTLALTLAAVVMAGSVPLLTGCGGGGSSYQAASNKTLGEELKDLQESYDKGIITKQQYEDTKKKLIKKYTR